MKNALIVIAALVAGFIVITIFEMLSYILFPLPEGIDPTSMTSIQANVHLIPTGALLLVAFAHFAGVVAALFVLAKYYNNRTAAYFIAAFIFAATATNLLLIPHPAWFPFVDIAAVVLGAFVGLLLMKKKKASAAS